MTSDPDRDRQGRSAQPFFGAKAVIGVSLLATAGFYLIARAHTWFFSDDYLALHLATVLPFSEFLTTPIDVHFLPLHRLATWGIYSYFPLNFDVALLVMCAFHVAGIWLLYRTLGLVGDPSMNGQLTVLCATNFYAAVLLTWWTVGIARFPYVFFSLAAIYQYLKFRQDGSFLRVVGLLVCVVGAAAFFTKALLFPGFLIALELALLPETPRRKVLRNAVVILIVAVAAFEYYRIGLSYGVDELESPPFHWAAQRAALETALIKVLQSLPGLLPSQPLSVLNWAVVGLWGLFFCISILRDRFNLVVWILGSGVVIVNFLVITLSQRTLLGLRIIAVDRYYYENLYLIAIFLAIIGNRMRIGEWLTKSPRGRVVNATTWMVAGLLIVGSQVRFVDALNTRPYAHFLAANEFGHNLTDGLAELRRTRPGTLYFANGPAPLPVLKIAAMEIRNYAEILPIFDDDVVFVGPNVCRYTIRDNGTIRPPGGTCP